MDQKTYGLTLKLQVNVTPDISIQFYGAPFTSIAKYDDFKLAADTKSHTFENRFQRIDPDQLTYADGVYTIGEGAGQMPFRNPDFRFNEFLQLGSPLGILARFHALFRMGTPDV